MAPLKSLSTARSSITVSFDIRTVLLITISAICASIFLLQPANQLHNATSLYEGSRVNTLHKGVPNFSVHESELTRMRKEQQHERLLSDMPSCASGRASTFLMVFMGHSGSTAVMTSLQQHSQTYIPNFEPVDHGIYREGSSKSHSLLALNYTFTFFNNASTSQLTSGFKIRPPNIIARPTEFALLVRKLGTRIIWSHRTNVFKQAISDYNIHVYGDKAGHEGFKVKNGTVIMDTSRGTSVRIGDMGKLHSLLKGRIRGEKEVERALRAISPDGCVLPVSYENYLSQPVLTLKRVQAFLGLDTEEIHPSLRAKANSDTICDLVQNWDEVCAAFFSCVQWRWMLDDFENGCSCTSLNPSKFGDSKKYCTLT